MTIATFNVGQVPGWPCLVARNSCFHLVPRFPLVVSVVSFSLIHSNNSRSPMPIREDPILHCVLLIMTHDLLTLAHVWINNVYITFSNRIKNQYSINNESTSQWQCHQMSELSSWPFINGMKPICVVLSNKMIMTSESFSILVLQFFEERQLSLPLTDNRIDHQSSTIRSHISILLGYLLNK